MTHMCSLKKVFFHYFTSGYLANESQTWSRNLGLASSKAQMLPTRQHCFVTSWKPFPGSASHQVWLLVWLLEFKLLSRPLSSAVLSLKLAWIPSACCQTSAPTLVLCQDISLVLPSPVHLLSSHLFLWLQVTPTHWLPNTKCWVCSHLSWPLGHCHPTWLNPGSLQGLCWRVANYFEYHPGYIPT